MKSWWPLIRYSRCYERQERQFCDVYGSPLFQLLPSMKQHAPSHQRDSQLPCYSQTVSALVNAGAWTSISQDEDRKLFMELEVTSAITCTLSVLCRVGEGDQCHHILERHEFPEAFGRAFKVSPKVTSLGFRYISQGEQFLFQAIFVDQFACKLCYEYLMRFGLLTPIWGLSLGNTHQTLPRLTQGQPHDPIEQKCPKITPQTASSEEKATGLVPVPCRKDDGLDNDNLLNLDNLPDDFYLLGSTIRERDNQQITEPDPDPDPEPEPDPYERETIILLASESEHNCDNLEDVRIGQERARRIILDPSLATNHDHYNDCSGSGPFFCSQDSDDFSFLRAASYESFEGNDRDLPLK